MHFVLSHLLILQWQCENENEMDGWMNESKGMNSTDLIPQPFSGFDSNQNPVLLLRSACGWWRDEVDGFGRVNNGDRTVTTVPSSLPSTSSLTTCAQKSFHWNEELSLCANNGVHLQRCAYFNPLFLHHPGETRMNVLSGFFEWELELSYGKKEGSGLDSSSS